MHGGCLSAHKTTTITTTVRKQHRNLHTQCRSLRHVYVAYIKHCRTRGHSMNIHLFLHVPSVYSHVGSGIGYSLMDLKPGFYENRRALVIAFRISSRGPITLLQLSAAAPACQRRTLEELVCGLCLDTWKILQPSRQQSSTVTRAGALLICDRD